MGRGLWAAAGLLSLLCGNVFANISIAIQQGLSQYGPVLVERFETAGYASSYSIFDNDAYMVGNITSFNVSLSGGALFQCMQLATHQTRAMNLLVSFDPANGKPLEYISGAIVSLKRPDIQNLADLRGKVVAAGQPTQISSFLSQYAALKRLNINIFSDLKELIVVYNTSTLPRLLYSSTVDAIFVSAASSYDYDPGFQFQVLGEQFDRNYPYRHTGDKFAAPVVSAIGNLDVATRKQLSIALLGTTKKFRPNLFGFSTPGDYSTIRNLMDFLGVINTNFTCNFVQNITELVQCPSGFRVNNSQRCDACNPLWTCICNACVKVNKPLSSVTVIIICFVCALVVFVMAAGFIINKLLKRRKQWQQLEVLTQHARDIFGHESAIKVIEWIGSGSCADVYRGYWYNNEVAFKVSRTASGDGGLTSFEGEIMTKLSHPNVIMSHQYSMTSNTDHTCWLITEFCNMGSLKRALESNLFRKEPVIVKQVLRQVAQGMAYIHSMGLVHGDLSCNNILLSKAHANPSLVAKISDFGHARYAGSHTRTIGTISHMAPEIFTSNVRHPKQDMYAMGVILWELTHASIYNVSNADIYSIINDDARPLIKMDLSPEVTALMHQCWNKDPQLRPGVSEFLAVIENL